MLDKYKINQIKVLLGEGHGIKTVARLTGVSRNTVRRYQRNIPRKGHHGPAWRAMDAKREELKKLFYACKGNCSTMHPFVENTIGVEPPSLRTLQKFCKPFRLEAKAEQADEGGGKLRNTSLQQDGLEAGSKTTWFPSSRNDI